MAKEDLKTQAIIIITDEGNITEKGRIVESGLEDHHIEENHSLDKNLRRVNFRRGNRGNFRNNNGFDRSKSRSRNRQFPENFKRDQKSISR